jgi:HEAT repeat protein
MDDPTLQRQARYSLGASAHSLKERDPALSESLVGELIQGLEPATSNDERVEYLTALGNAGHPASLETLAKFLKHENSGVRAAAANALRRIPGGKADQLLAQALEDPSASVRASALDAMMYRDASPVLVYAVRDLLAKEPNSEVRSGAIRVAARWASQAPALHASLERIAASDPDSQVRELASRSL